ncbi:MAG: YoaK family protein [Rikenellaceae bacterium]
MKQRTFNRLTSLWIYSIGFMSAYINMLTIAYYTYAVSHCTGNFVDIIYDAWEHKFERTLTLAVICSLFLAGGILASFVNRRREFDISHRYGEAQIICGLVILLCNTFLSCFDIIFLASMSLIMGIQNALIYSYRGVSFKPSHLTTTFSNLGQYIGEYMMNMAETKRDIAFELSLVASFALGTACSLLLFSFIGSSCFTLASTAYIALGFAFIAIRRSSSSRLE